jgi:exopolysaccharide biosynthesis glucuronosyltransferase PssD
VSTSETPPSDDYIDQYYSVSDSNFQQKFRLIVTAIEVFVLFVKVRPQVIVSTGAAPGLFAVFFGVLFRRKAVWIDSIANADRLSLAGRVALKLTPYCYTQWPHLVTSKGPQYIGAVI